MPETAAMDDMSFIFNLLLASQAGRHTEQIAPAMLRRLFARPVGQLWRLKSLRRVRYDPKDVEAYLDRCRVSVFRKGDRNERLQAR